MKPLGLFVIFIVPGCTAQERLKAQEKLPFPVKPGVKRLKEQLLARCCGRGLLSVALFFSACFPRLKTDLETYLLAGFSLSSPYHLPTISILNRHTTGYKQAIHRHLSL